MDSLGMDMRCCDEMHDGNLFFEHKYPSIDIDRAIDRMNSFEEFEQFYTDDLMDENLLMGRYLSRLLERYNVSPNKAALDIGKTHSYVRKIIKGDELNPSRDVLLAICVLIGATVEETQILLKYSGKQPLYARRKRDAIVWFALKKRPLRKRVDGKMYLKELNDYLEDNEYKSLSKIILRKD